MNKAGDRLLASLVQLVKAGLQRLIGRRRQRLRQCPVHDWVESLILVTVYRRAMVKAEVEYRASFRTSVEILDD